MAKGHEGNIWGPEFQEITSFVSCVRTTGDVNRLHAFGNINSVRMVLDGSNNLLDNLLSALHVVSQLFNSISHACRFLCFFLPFLVGTILVISLLNHIYFDRCMIYLMSYDHIFALK